MAAPKIYKSVKICYSKTVPSKTKSKHFTIPYESNKYIIYVPKKGILALVNKEFVEQRNTNHRLVTGFFKFVDSQDTVPTLRAALSTIPTVTLLLTTDCNMRCTYCCSNTGSTTVYYMPWSIAKTAIDYGIKKSDKTFLLSLFSAGEPSLAFDLMKRCYSYAKKECDARGIELRVSSTTNGTLNESQVKWFKKIGAHVQLSFDGPPSIQNAQRPLLSGNKSYHSVRRTIAMFNKYGVSYGVSATFTKYCEGRMMEILKHFVSLKIKRVSFAPCRQFGRASALQLPDLEKFVHESLRCIEFAEKHGIYLSGLQMSPFGLTIYGCNSSGPLFVVHPRGKILSCLVASDLTDSVCNTFVYGSINGNKVRINPKKLNLIRNITVHRINACASCFCKYICAGYCPYNNLSFTGSLFKPSKEICTPMKDVVKYFLGRLLTKPIDIAEYDVLIEDTLPKIKNCY
ncbi:MAG: radical SAM protein [archaeon]